MSPTLYEIEGEMRELLAQIDPETGEISEELAAKLEAVELSEEDKLVSYAHHIKNQLDLLNRIKIEMTRLTAYKNEAENNVAACKERMEMLVPDERKVRIQRVDCNISWRKSTKVELGDDTDAIINGLPDRYLTEKPAVVSIDKVTLKEAMKEGHEFYGCQLVTRKSVQIK